MAIPVIVNIDPEWAWEIVATSVKSGMIHRIKSTVSYYQTYRLTGQAAPTAPTVGTIPTEAIEIFIQSNSMPISSQELIDVYIMCKNKDADVLDTGQVRVDV